MRTEEKGKILSQPDATTFGKIEGINVISYILYNDIPDMTVAIYLRNRKVLDEPISNDN